MVKNTFSFAITQFQSGTNSFYSRAALLMRLKQRRKRRKIGVKNLGQNTAQEGKLGSKNFCLKSILFSSLNRNFHIKFTVETLHLLVFRTIVLLEHLSVHPLLCVLDVCLNVSFFLPPER